MRRVRRHLSYANVVSTLCLVLLVGGGTALASAIVTRNGQVGRSTISGHNPPAGDHPNVIAASVSGKDLSQGLRTSLRLHCPSGFQNAGDICFENTAHTGDPFVDAVKTCAAAGLRLPTMPELALVFEHSGAPQIAQWVATEYPTTMGR